MVPKLQVLARKLHDGGTELRRKVCENTGSVSKKSRAEIVYLVHKEALGPVFHSQVLAPLLALAGAFRICLVVLVPTGHLLRGNQRRRLKQIRNVVDRSQALSLHLLPLPPSRTPRLWSDVGVFSSWLRTRFKKRDRFVLHCRAVNATLCGLDAVSQFPNAKVIFDCRGCEPEEFLHQQTALSDCASVEIAPDLTGVSPALLEEYRRRATKLSRCASESDAVFAVSTRLARYLSVRAGGRKIDCVIPCCPDLSAFSNARSTRREIRESLGFSGKCVLVYCGSLAWYQFPDRSIELFLKLKQLHDRLHFLAITHERGPMLEILASSRVSELDSTVISLPPDEVPKYMAAADIGLLQRDQTLVNRVAAPVKFGEYMAAGLPVLISQNVGDFSDAVDSYELGVLGNAAEVSALQLDKMSKLTREVLSDRLTFANRCTRYANESLGWAVYLPSIAKTYKGLLRSDCDT